MDISEKKKQYIFAASLQCSEEVNVVSGGTPRPLTQSTVGIDKTVVDESGFGRFCGLRVFSEATHKWADFTINRFDLMTGVR